MDAPGTAEDLSYVYDNVGNRLNRTDATETLLYTYNANNQLTQVERDELIDVLLLKYVYDANGNRIEKLNGSDVVLQSYVYDQKNRTRMFWAFSRL